MSTTAVPDGAAVCSRLAARTDIPVAFLNLSRKSGEHNAVMANLRHAREGKPYLYSAITADTAEAAIDSAFAMSHP